MIRVRFACDMIATKFSKFLISVFLICISLILVMLLIMMYVGENISYLSCDKVLSKGGEKTLIVYAVGKNGEVGAEKSFLKGLKDIEGVHCAGSSMNNVLPKGEMSELLAIQKKNVRDIESYMLGRLEIQTVDGNVFKLTNITIEDGLTPEEIEFVDNTRYFYVGSAYKDVNVGDEYDTEYGKSVIVGRLSNDCEWVDDRILNTFCDTSILDYSLDTEYMVFEIANEERFFSCYYFLSVEDEYTVSEIKEKLVTIAETQELEVTFTTVKEMFDEEAKTNSNVMLFVIEFIALLLPIVIIMLISSQLVIMLLSSRQYGIMYAVGYSKNEISGMLLIYQIITALISYVISTGVVYLFGTQIYKNSADMSDVLEIVLLQYAFPAGLIMAALTVAIVQIVTNITLSKMTPDKLIRSNV